ncbi:helix-turn-helix domain-containing protein [Lacrimispora sp.]|uniref:helix-turn-helix domain-containing protein n=1 Tax=Lacrimispora sp. TaxID=2719234 RepID=UPI0039E625DE
MIKGAIMVNSTLGEKLLELRTSRNLTQQQVSDALHIGRVTYTYYEGNKRTPDLSLLLSICKFYGIEIKELINENTIPVFNPEVSVEGPIKATGVVGTSNLGINLISNVLEGALGDLGVKPPFTKMEKELITNFRQLNSEDKEEVSHLIKYKLKKQKKK